MKLPTFSQNTDPALRKLDRFVEVFMLVGILAILLLVCCSCSSTKAVTQLVEHIQKDTIYLSNVQYDSIYIYQDKYTDRSRDTLYIKDKSIEYRYKLLRDTVKVVQRDSIPYEVRVESIKEIPRKHTWIDVSAYSWMFLSIVSICFGLYKKLR